MGNDAIDHGLWIGQVFGMPANAYVEGIFFACQRAKLTWVLREEEVRENRLPNLNLDSALEYVFKQC